MIVGTAGHIDHGKTTLVKALTGVDTDRLAATVTAAASKAGKNVEDVRAAQQAQIPAGRYGRADEFGAICAFLCSVQAGYMTGQNVLADGGAYPGTF